MQKTLNVTIPVQTRITISSLTSKQQGGKAREGVMYDANLQVGKCANVFFDHDHRPTLLGPIIMIEKDEHHKNPYYTRYELTIRENGKQEEKIEILVARKGVNLGKIKHKVRSSWDKRKKKKVA